MAELERKVQKQAEYRYRQRQEVRKILEESVSKHKLCRMIDESMENERSYNQKKSGLGESRRSKEGKKSRKRRSGQQRVEGRNQVIMRRDGQMWLLPQEVSEELTWRREPRRRIQPALWEAPPPGPPGGKRRDTGNEETQP